MSLSLDAYWLVSLTDDSDTARAASQCIVRVSTSDILRDLSRGAGSLIRRHFHRDGDLAGYIADHLETVRRVVACEVVAPLYFSSFAPGGGLWKWRDAQQVSAFHETTGPSGNIGDFPVWQCAPAPAPSESSDSGRRSGQSGVAGRWLASGDREQARTRLAGADLGR